MNFSEIRHDYIWGPAVENGANGGHDLLAAVSIDAWKSADDNEEGEVLANVLLTAHGDMIVDFHDNASTGSGSHPGSRRNPEADLAGKGLPVQRENSLCHGTDHSAQRDGSDQ